MTRRIERLNEQLKSELANLIAREITLDNGLITVSYVDCSADLKQAKIGVSILPENLTGSCLEKLQKSSYYFCQILRHKLKIRQIPKFRWVLDTTEREAAEIEKIIAQIHQEEK